MLYLLDANILITAHNTYYPMDRVPQFWEWILEQAHADKIKIPVEIYEEIIEGTDVVAKWVKEHKKVICLVEDVDQHILQDVVTNGYAPDLDDTEYEQIKKDPFLVAYACMKPDRCVVTLEVSKPGKKRANRKVPDVCDTFKVKCCDTFKLI